MNVTQTEYDRIARQYGYLQADTSYPYSLVYQYANSEHTWTLYFSDQAERQRFADNIRSLGGRVVGASHGEMGGIAR